MRKRILLSAVLLVWLLILGGCQRKGATVEQVRAVAASGIGVSLGATDAPVTVVEFSDFQCRGCAQSAELVFPVIQPFVESGQVRYIFMDLPLPQHKNSRQASQAAHCADRQERWADMHDLLFEQQIRWGNANDPSASLEGYAGSLGLDMAEFKRCMADETIAAKIERSAAEAIRLQVNTTPSLFIQGRPVPLSPEKARLQIDAALKGAGR